MLKKLVVALVTFIILASLSTVAFAGSNTADPQAEIRESIAKTLKSGDVADNGQFIMTVRNPENISEEVNTYSKRVNIAGSTKYSDLIVLIAKLDKETGTYNIIELPDGDESIPVLSDYFSVELDLEYGENNLLLISYRQSETDTSMIQYNVIKINIYKETIPQKIARATKKFGETVLDIFTGKK